VSNTCAATLPAPRAALGARIEWILANCNRRTRCGAVPCELASPASDGEVDLGGEVLERRCDAHRVHGRDIELL
jgi:hypothetical protein